MIYDTTCTVEILVLWVLLQKHDRSYIYYIPNAVIDIILSVTWNQNSIERVPSSYLLPPVRLESPGTLVGR